MKRPPSRWLLLPVLLLLVAALCQRVIALRRQADECQQLQLSLAHAMALVARLQTLELGVLHGPSHHRVAARGELDASKADLLRTAETLRSYEWAHLPPAALVERIGAYARAVDDEFAVMSAGDLRSAARVDDAEVDPAYAALLQAVKDYDQKANVVVRERMHSANVTLILLCLVCAGAVAGVFVGDEKLRRSMMRHEREALQRREHHFRVLTEHAFDGVLIVGPDLKIVYATPSVSSILDLAPGAAMGRRLLDFVAPADRAYVAEHLGGTDCTRPTRMEFSISAGETFRFVEAAIRDLRADPEIGGFVLNLRDIDAQKRAQGQLLHNALHDDLTALPNRMMFMQRLEAALDHARRAHLWSVGLLFIDIDDFKTINDSLGHCAGDTVIVQVAERITRCVRGSDVVARNTTPGPMVARLGGDEFTVMLDAIYDPADAVRVCERIHHAMRMPVEVNKQPIYVSVSVGVAVSDGAWDGQELLRNADMAMYRAKSQGKGRFALFDTEMHARAAARLKLETDLRIALESEQFVLHYQPIVELATGQVRRAEALLRWKRGGSSALTMPGAFVGVAEESGLILDIGHWVLRTAVMQAAAWNRATPQAVIVCVNISGKQFTHAGFLDQVTSALADSCLSPDCLELEITEGVAMEDAARTQAVIAKLREIGVRLALDDFGTGYSSLSYLRKFSVNTLKIDRSFICDIPENRENVAIVHTIIKLATILGLEVIAEGIETRDQLVTIERAGCALAQGFLLMKPGPAHTAAWTKRSPSVALANSNDCGMAWLAKAADPHTELAFVPRP